MPPPRTPSCSGSPGSLGRSSGAAPRTPTRLQPGGWDGRQPPVSPRMDIWPWKTLVSRACGCSPLALSPGAGATCGQVRRHHPCIAPECHEPAEQLAAGTKNSFKASVGKFREGKCFETGCVNAPPPSWPRAVRLRSTLGGSTGCQSSSRIPGLAPSLHPPSSWGARRCPVPPADSCSPSLSPAHVQRQLEHSMILLKPP